MMSLFFLECLFIGIAFLHSSPAFTWFRIAWVWGIPFTLILSLMMDLADKGVTAIDTPFFCCAYVMPSAYPYWRVALCYCVDIGGANSQ